MKNGKYERVSPAGRKPRRALLPLILVILILTVTVGGTLAYITAAAGPITNLFNPGQVSCQVNGDLSITNTSNVQAYIRAMVVVNWVDGNGNVYGTAPEYTVATNTGWTLDESTGIYYYTSPVAPNPSKIVAPATVSCEESAPSGYTLQIEVVAEAIQAEGMGAGNAQQAWQIAQGN